MESQRRALEEIATRRRGRKEGVIVILDEGDEEAGPSNPVRHGDPGQGCSKDGGGASDNDDDGDDGDDNDGDYTTFYKLLGM
ncbi:putative WRKY transcription factor 35 [Hordeum vulgare]|nr:putative WRKY transcription factor 35 [Hordeum vulgare]